MRVGIGTQGLWMSTDRRRTMTITEADRFEMHLELRKFLADKVAETLMEHLPPSGWGDVARRSDIDHLRDQFADLKATTCGLAAGMWALGSLTAAGFIGLFTVIATKF